MKGRYYSIGCLLIAMSLLAGCTYVVPPPPGFAMDDRQSSSWHAHYRSPEVKAMYDTETGKWSDWDDKEECRVCGKKPQSAPYPGEKSIMKDDDDEPRQAYERPAKRYYRPVLPRRGWCIVPGFRMPWLPLDFSVKKCYRYICVPPE